MFAVGNEPATGRATRVRWLRSNDIHPAIRWTSAICVASACSGLSPIASTTPAGTPR